MQRPRYHFTPPKHWMNDPNGLMFCDGWYHIFYQHNPDAADWGTMHWGHARTRDFLRYEHLPLALAPETERGEAHCFSGCAVQHADEVFLFYTSVGFGGCQTDARQRRARSGDMLRFERDDWVLEAPAGITDWRDPFIYSENGSFIMLTGGSLGGRGVVLRHSSQDLDAWQYDGILFQDSTTSYLECPNFLRFGERALLFYSRPGGVVFHSGRTADGRFYAKKTGSLDKGAPDFFYAPQVFCNDPLGRYLLLGWVPERTNNGVYAGALTLPRVITLTPDGLPSFLPAAEIASLACFSDPAENLYVFRDGDLFEIFAGGAVWTGRTG